LAEEEQSRTYKGISRLLAPCHTRTARPLVAPITRPKAVQRHFSLQSVVERCGGRPTSIL